MVRGGRAEAHVSRSDVSFRLDQKTGNFKEAFASRPMQWSAFSDVVLRLCISVALQQKTANFKVATLSRPMQWSALTEGKQTNELAQKEFRFIKTITIIRGGNYPSPFASISALHCSKRRVISRWPFIAEQCSGVRGLKKRKRMNLLHENDENK
jgi:hypothetical protein